MAELATAPDGKQMLTVDDAVDLERWLTTEHTRPAGVWLVRARPGSDVAPLDYEDMIEILLCYGWIDAVIKTLDERRSLLWISPRRKGSVWSKPNKERVERLQAAGRLQPSGEAVIERAKADGSWTVIDSAENLEVPGDLAAALDATTDARAHFEAYPPSVRKVFLASIAMAKTPATRTRRIAATVRKAAANERP
jgi:uncharacterized protein YdeI (YjbR/CyaY-like superfamily)